MMRHTPIGDLLPDFVLSHSPKYGCGRLVHVERGFLRIGRSPRRFVIARRDLALFTVRNGAFLRLGDWFFYLGR